ncbi:MAG: IS1595 family transposase [Candidatus Dadabacteria bacterium]|nr:IS1595 family transposase [Candidatus Dadabacteria bacterium]NIS08699.1 IS1595 family transposase [Candidatus Dadabacteria bacterium]NIV42181.1 IS1595 family transposase [Candidatus Dadabacteria bacterium]NIX15385.1 IS1595 family transposase [Candidatus Dadabacteria bacterium]NIY22048.1 IS1595 family transposase [Candidatus Dadabacteria bacterium]
MKHLTIKQFFDKYKDDDTCLEHIMKCRYGLSGECPKCHKQTNYSKVTSQRAYACQWCGWHVYPCVGTPFERSSTSLVLWFYAIYLFTTNRSGVSAMELKRQLGVTYKTAWRMAKEIRIHMSKVDGDEKLTGVVEIDETMYGGKRSGKRGRGAENKTVVTGMMEKSGELMTKVVPNIKKKTLQTIIENNIEKGSELHTDELLSYTGLKDKGYVHKRVNHGDKQYVNGDCQVNGIEGFWARLKLSIQGTHVHVSPKYLLNYVREFEYRFNSRHQPQQMFDESVSRYQPLS